MVRNAVHFCVLKHFDSKNAVTMHSDSFSTIGTAFPLEMAPDPALFLRVHSRHLRRHRVARMFPFHQCHEINLLQPFQLLRLRSRVSTRQRRRSVVSTSWVDIQGGLKKNRWGIWRVFLRPDESLCCQCCFDVYSIHPVHTVLRWLVPCFISLFWVYFMQPPIYYRSL